LTGATRRSYFNTFDLEFDTELHFIISRFAFVRWGECIDCVTVLTPRPIHAGMVTLRKPSTRR
jgi:hypothetical protein